MGGRARGAVVRRVGAVLVTVACGAGLAGCGSSAGATSDGSSGTVAVVASTDVWGDVVKTVGGDHVTVTSFISDPDQDPHSYEADAQNLLALSKARLVVENGGGYDDFMGRMLDSSGATATVLDAVRISGKTAPAGGDLNEHVWYDIVTVRAVAGQVASQISRLDPGATADVRANLARFDTALAGIVADEATCRRRYAGRAIGITEPVPLYMTDACGLVDKTPAAFSEAVEEGDDVAPSVLARTLRLYQDHQVRALVYNQQTSGPVTEQVKSAAAAAGIAVVPVTETLPAGTTFVTWMRGNLAAIERAVAS